MGRGLAGHALEPWLDDGKLAWRAARARATTPTCCGPRRDPFSPEGGLKVLRATRPRP